MTFRFTVNTEDGADTLIFYSALNGNIRDNSNTLSNWAVFTGANLATGDFIA